MADYYATPLVKYVRLQWQHLNGMRCSKMIPVSEYLKEDYELHICPAAFFTPICYNEWIKGCGDIDKTISMRPDRATYRVLPWCPTQATVMCDFYDEDGQPWKYCPRGFVKKAVKELQE